jgi:hypothetical protein
MSRKLGEVFVQQFVLGFGFLGGFWIHVGINPENEILKALSIIGKSFAFNSNFSLLFWMIPTLDMILSLFFTYVVGGLLGIIAVFLAFVGGIFINLV